MGAMSAAVLLGFMAGAGGALSAAEAAGAAARVGARFAPGLARVAAETVARASREGRAPAMAERRRLAFGAALAGFAGGLLLAGPWLGLLLAMAAPWAADRAVRARRDGYRRAVDAGAAAIAISLADALGGGHSLRGAVTEAARGGVAGAAGRELRRLAGELALGGRTDDALEAFRRRVRSHRVDTLVAACLLQRRAGGDLAFLLRECARAFEDQARLEDEARAATAQARFTGLVVVLLPLGGALLAELASPGYLGGLAGSPLTLLLAVPALALQCGAALLIRRLARVRV
jgi:tight adherence protein B